MIQLQAKLAREKLNITPEELEQIKTFSQSFQSAFAQKADKHELWQMGAEKTNK